VGVVLVRYLRKSQALAEEKDVDVTSVLARTPLSAADRCDRCGARAYLRANMPSGGELLFCAHHAREHGDALRAAGMDIQDETGQLADVPATAPSEER
jgi:hypothetical protein